MPDTKVVKRNPDDRIIALAGNPNVGKSTVFNELTGLHQHTGNWPGKTVSSACGYCRHNGHGYVIVDIPGTYSLSAHSADEEVARDFLCSEGYDAVVVVCDTTCLERNLPLVLQILEITDKVAVCLNLMDEAEKKGISIDSYVLSGKLGVPVIKAAARSGKGVSDILSSVEKLISEKKDTVQQRTVKSMPELIVKSEEIYQSCTRGKTDGYTKTERRIDKLLTNRIIGFPIMLLLFALIFWLTIEGANYPSEFLSGFLSGLETPIKSFLLSIRMPDVIVEALSAGMWRTLAWVVAVMLPPMAIFFPLFTILEDLGYLPRIAFNLDRAFRCCNACGKQSLTMCMGFGCNAAGVVGCRIIDSPRERLIAILTNTFVPCNGRFPAIITLITVFLVSNSALSATLLTLFILFGIIMTFLASKLLSSTVLRGVPSSFTLELPPYRRPQIGKVIVRSIFDRTLFVLGRAVAVAAPAGLLLWIMANFSIGGLTILTHFASFLDPFGRILGLDGVILAAFILALPANEIVLPIAIMAYTAGSSLTEITALDTLSELLCANGWNAVTAICFILFSLMHWPCSTTLATIKNETQSLGWTFVAFLTPTLFGIIICAIVNLLAGPFI